MLKTASLLIVAALLAACATQPPAPITDESHENWQTNLARLDTFNQWAIRGRVALFTDDDVYNLGLDWQRNADQHQLTLEASLGQGVIQVQKKPGQGTLKTPEGETYTGANARQLLAQVTGLDIPVEGLETWIRGIPHDQSSFLPDIDAAGRASSLAQDGWRINYLEYQPVEAEGVSPLMLPKKLYLKQQKVALKIVIDQWLAAAEQPASPLFPSFPD